MFAVVLDTSSHFLIFKLQLGHFIIFNSGASGILYLQFMQMYVFLISTAIIVPVIFFFAFWCGFMFSASLVIPPGMLMFSHFSIVVGRAEIFFFVPIQLKFFKMITALLFNFGDLTFPQSYSYRSSSVSDKQCYIWWGFFFACFEYTVSSSPLNKTLAFSPTDWPFGALCRIALIGVEHATQTIQRYSCE